MILIVGIELIPPGDMEVALAQFDAHYQNHYRQLMLRKLGFETLPLPTAAHLVRLTLQVLETSSVEYADFFNRLAESYQPTWGKSDGALAISTLLAPRDEEAKALFEQWQSEYVAALILLSVDEWEMVASRLRKYNPASVPTRPEIESVWEPITTDDNWGPFYELIANLQSQS